MQTVCLSLVANEINLLTMLGSRNIGIDKVIAMKSKNFVPIEGPYILAPGAREIGFEGVVVTIYPR